MIARTEACKMWILFWRTPQSQLVRIEGVDKYLMMSTYHAMQYTNFIRIFDDSNANLFDDEYMNSYQARESFALGRSPKAPLRSHAFSIALESSLVPQSWGFGKEKELWRLSGSPVQNPFYSVLDCFYKSVECAMKNFILKSLLSSKDALEKYNSLKHKSRIL